MARATEEEAYAILTKLNIPYERIDHEPVTSVKHYDAILPGPQVKNLLLRTRKADRFYFVVVDEKKRVDLKALAVQLGSPRLSFATGKELYDLLGVEAGTVTPIALNHDEEGKIQLVIDSAIDRASTMGFHPNVNTTTIIVRYEDMERIFEFSGHLPIYADL
ncbi:MAG: prolyl-tRNA synthetase associated domain-containing protein [Bacillus sp. (in: firmicutes)]